MTDPTLSIRGLTKSHRKGRRRLWRRKPRGIEVPVLLGVDLDVEPGEFVSVVGKSGSGKSTLLHVVGTLDEPDSGEVWLGERRIDGLPPRERDRVRNEVFGLIFQFYHLLPELTATENVLAPLAIRHGVLSYWARRREFRRHADELLEKVGLAHRAKHRPSELSGGEMQRTAIARALAGRPQILLADEPTGNLDAATGQEIVELLGRLNHDEGLTIIMVTHDQSLAARADRIVRLVDGRIDTSGDRPFAAKPEPAERLAC